MPARATRYWVASSASLWSNTANWSTTSGGAGGASVPGSSDTVYFDRGSANCTLTAATTIAAIGIAGYTGTIDMAGFNFTISGSYSCTFASGKITNSLGTAATLSINTSATAFFSGTQFGTSLTQAPLINSSSGSLLLSGSVFYGVSSFTKTGSTLDYAGTGNNTFNTTVSFTNAGTGALALGYAHPDIFNGDVTFNNTGTSDIEAANNTAGNMFNGNIIVNNPNGGGGVTFAAYSGSSATLASGKTITVGTTFTAGYLSLQRFTQLGTTAQTLTLTGTTALTLGPSSTFNGNVTFKSPRMILRGTTYNGTAYLEKTGATEDYANTGGNVFNGVTSLVNSGSANFITGYSSADTYNADVTLKNTGTAAVRVGDNTAGNAFNGNILVNSTAGNGIIFDQNSSGFSTLADGKTISVGSSGFTAGTLNLTHFTQVGTTSQSITQTGSSVLSINSSTFNANTTTSAPSITLFYSTFNGTVNMTNTGSVNSNNYGFNVFNDVSTFTATGTGNWLFGTIFGDTYNSNTIWAQTGTGAIEPAYSNTHTFMGDITVNSSTAVKFGLGNGTVALMGGSVQNITSASSIPVFQNLMVNNSNGVVLKNEITIGSTATLNSGIITSTSSNFLNFAAGSSVSGASNSSYVDGPVQKVGNTAFTYPIGNGGYYAPFSISAPVNTTDRFTAQYWHADPNAIAKYTTSFAPTIKQVTDLEYWNLSRGGGSAAVSVTLSWDNGRSGTVSAPAQMTVAWWDGSMWQDKGNGGTTGSASSGTVVSQSAVSSFGYFTLATTSTMNTLPVTWGNFTASWSSYNDQKAALLKWNLASESGNSYFEVQRSSADVVSWASIGTVASLGDNVSGNSYTAWDKSPLTGTALYRIKQVSLDGTYSYSKVVTLSSSTNSPTLRLWPNPVESGAWIEVSQLNGQRISILLTDAAGRAISRQETVVASDLSEIALPISGLAAGAYFVSVTNVEGKTLMTKQLIKLK